MARVAEVEAEEQKYLAAIKAWAEERKKFQATPGAGGIPSGEFTIPRPAPPPFVARVEANSEEVGGSTRIIERPRNKWGNRLTVLHNHPPLKVSGSYLTHASSVYDENGRPAVSFRFNSEGAGRFAEMTGPNKGRLLAIVLDDHIREVATIKSRIYDQGQLTGNFTRDDVRSIVTVLNGGSLPASLKLVEETTIGGK